MLKFSSIVVAIIFMLVLLPSARAMVRAGSEYRSGMYAGVSAEGYDNLNGALQAQLPPLEVIGVPCAEQGKNLSGHIQGPPKGISQQEWNRNDDFLGPSHSGMERHFLWQ